MSLLDASLGMRLLIAAALVLVVPGSSLAQDQSGPGTLHESVAREATRLAAGRQTTAAFQAPCPSADAGTGRCSPQEKSWIARHPALTGALIGLGVGVPIGIATCHYPTAEGSSCSDFTYPGNARLLGGLTMGAYGAGIGAGVGALAGVLAR